jgi:hypothetical protein
MANKFSDPNYTEDFDRRTKKSIEYIGAKRVHPVFVDTAERLKSVFTTPKKAVHNIELSNWHLPFKRLILISGDIILELVEEEEESFKNIRFTLTTLKFGDYCTGEFLIYKTDEPPVVTINSEYTINTEVSLKENWKILVLSTKFKDKNGKPIPNNLLAAKNDVENMSRGVVISAIYYFYPFCVDKEMFVVESQVARKKKGKTQTRGKSTYSIMHVTKIMKRFTPTGHTGQPLTKGHPRRAHIRKYRSDRWTNMQGQTIIVNSTWVGPKTVLSEGRLYKVHTDVY